MRDIPSQSAMEKLREQREAVKMSKGGLYENIHAKRERIAEGSGEKMRKPGSKGAPTEEAFKQAAKTAKMADGGEVEKTAPEAEPVAEKPAMQRLGEYLREKGAEGAQAFRQGFTDAIAESPIIDAARTVARGTTQLASGLTGIPMPEQEPMAAQPQAAAPTPTFENVPLPEQPEVVVEPEVPLEKSEALATAERGQQMIESAALDQDKQALQEMDRLKQVALTAEEDKALAKLEYEKNVNPYLEYIEKNKVDPGRFLGNMSTLGRIQQSIAFMLGGIGGALAGTENYAWKAFQNAVDRDVQAQKETMDTKNNMVSAFQKIYKNEIDAIDAAAAFQYKLGALKTQQLAAQTSSKIIAGKALMASQKMQAEEEERLSRIAARRTAAKAEQQFAQQKPQTEQEVAQIIQNIPDAATRKEVRESRKLVVNGISALNDFKNNMQKQFAASRIGSRVMSPIQSSQIMAAITPLLVPTLKQLIKENRMTDADLKIFIKPFETTTLTSYDTVQEKIKNLESSLMSGLKGDIDLLSGYNIVTPKLISATKRETIK